MFKKNLHQKFFWLLILLLPFQLGKHFWPNWSFLLGLKVDYFSPTLYLTDILIFLILFLWGIEMIFSSKQNFISKSHNPFSTLHLLKKHWWIIIIFVYFLINALLAKNPEIALYKFIKIIEFTLLGFYIVKNKISLSNVFYPLSLAVIYSSLIALAQFLKQSSLNGIFWWFGERTFNLSTPGIAKTILNGQLVLRPYGIFSHPNALAGFILISLVLLINWLAESKTRNLIKCLALILGSLIITISFSRSVWFLSLLVVFYFAIRKNFFQKKKFFFICLLFFLFSCLLIIIIPHFSTNEAFSQRKQLIDAALLMIKNFPLSGVGLNNFIFSLPNYWSLVGFTYWLQPVHNIYFLIAAETGFTGLIIFIWFLILTLRRLFKYLSIFSLTLILVLMLILLLGLNDHYWLTLQQNQLLLTFVIGLSWSKLS